MVEQEPTPGELDESPVEDLELAADDSEAVQGGRAREPIEIIKRIDKSSP
jgi:hypothetical protein